MSFKYFINIFIIQLVLISFLSRANDDFSVQLNLVQSYEIQTNNSIEPSGLTEWDGDFYTVSDKHNAIFKLVFEDKKVNLVSVIDIQSKEGEKLDFEGITHDDEFFYLISELSFRILKISKDGLMQEWVNTENKIYESGTKAGLFQVENAYLEGICILTDGTFLLASERQPRGFVEIDSNNQYRAYQVDESMHEYKPGVSPDFSGLSCDEKIYGINRNAYAINELKKVDNKFKEFKSYSYKHIVTSPHLKYQNMDYGHAEGLVVIGNYFYILLDNNKINFEKNPNNSNSLFLKMEK